jgi:hypothetical protein
MIRLRRLRTSRLLVRRARARRLRARDLRRRLARPAAEARVRSSQLFRPQWVAARFLEDGRCRFVGVLPRADEALLADDQDVRRVSRGRRRAIWAATPYARACSRRRNALRCGRGRDAPFEERAGISPACWAWRWAWQRRGGASSRSEPGRRWRTRLQRQPAAEVRTTTDPLGETAENREPFQFTRTRGLEKSVGRGTGRSDKGDRFCHGLDESRILQTYT